MFYVAAFGIVYRLRLISWQKLTEVTNHAGDKPVETANIGIGEHFPLAFDDLDAWLTSLAQPA